SAEAMRAGSAGVGRASLPAAAERARAEDLQARVVARDRPIGQVRETTRHALQSAEEQLAAAAQKLSEMPARPELLELRSELQRKLETVSADADAARAAAQAAQAALAVRDSRQSEALASAKEAL